MIRSSQIGWRKQKSFRLLYGATTKLLIILFQYILPSQSIIIYIITYITILFCSQSPPNIANALTVGGVPTKGNADYKEEAVQATHAPKPVNPVPQKPMHNIIQPRK